MIVLDASAAVELLLNSARGRAGGVGSAFAPRIAGTARTWDVPHERGSNVGANGVDVCCGALITSLEGDAWRLAID